MGRSLRSTCLGLVVRFHATPWHYFHFPLVGPDLATFWTIVHRRRLAVDVFETTGELHSLPTYAVFSPRLRDLLCHARRADRRVCAGAPRDSLARAVHSTGGIHVLRSAKSLSEQRS